MIVVKELTKSFGTTVVLRGVSHVQTRGQVVTLIGPSGCGKSTFLRCLNRLETPDSGTIAIDGEIVSPVAGDSAGTAEKRRFQARARTGMVFQSFNLFPHLTVLGNVVEAPVHVQGRPLEEVREEGMQLLRKVGLEDRKDFRPSALSGGQQQRVAIAKLAMKPAIMLFDEPTSALDPEMREEVLRVIQNLSDEGMTMVIVTHEMEFARAAADFVVFFDRGRVAESGTPEQVFGAPQQERTREFLRSLGEPTRKPFRDT